MKSFESLQEAIAGKTMELAKRLHMSVSNVYKWQEPHTDYTDSGSYNPLDRIETIVETALGLGVPKEKALMPVFWLNHRFDLVAFPIPPPGAHPVNAALIATIKEFADMAQATAEALADNRISPIEAKDIIGEAEGALRAIGILIHSVKEAVR